MASKNMERFDKLLKILSDMEIDISLHADGHYKPIIPVHEMHKATQAIEKLFDNDIPTL